MERMTRNEKRLLAVAVVLAAAACVFTWVNYAKAFPEASLEFKVNRSTSQPVAETFLREHAERTAAALAGRRHAAIFRVDGDAKVYLERELGLEKLSELIARREVRLWSWSHRYFRPLDKEEVRVEVSPEGDVVGFTHPIPEEAAGASLDEAPARELAQRFLASAFALPPEKLTFIESHREDRPHRRDWAFTFERAGWKAGEATYRMQVEVHGDEPAAYREFLKVPDAWTQSYKRLRSANETTATVALLGIVLTMIAAVWVIVRQARRGNLRWRVTLAFTAISFVLVFLLSLNGLPLAAYGFDTTDTWAAFLTSQALAALAGAGAQSLLILIVVAAGEPLYRERFGSQLRVGALLAAAGWRSKRAVIGLVLGYCLAALFIAYQVAFYVVGGRFGAWNPAEVPFDNMLNTSFPWLAVLFMGFYPAVSEEFMSRVLSIPLVEKLARSRLAAIVIPALIWGFAHANYPAQPFYIRGVEVSLAGLAVGVILYRFGVLPCLVWHYVVDAGYTSILLVRSGNPYFVITAIAGTGALLVPLAIALAAAWRRGGFVPDAAVVNAADPAPPEPPAAEPPPLPALGTPPLGSAAATAGVLLVAGIALLRLAPDPGGGIGVTLRPAEVRTIAEEFLRGRGVDPASWRLVVTARGQYLDRNARRYLLEHGGIEQVARFGGELPAWDVRAFRPEDREQWRLAVDDRARKVVRFTHSLREEAPGAELPVGDARARAEAELRGSGFDPATLEFKEASTQKRPARTDHGFTWKDPARSVGEAEYLIDVSVQGDAVDGQSRRLKLPEAWERSRDKGTVLRYGLLAAKIAAIAWLVVHGLLAFYRGVRAGAIPWKPIAGVAAVVVVLAGLGAWLGYPLVWSVYDVTWPEATFRASMLVAVGMSLLMQGGLAILALGALSACFPVLRGLTAAPFRRAGATSGALAAAGVAGGLWLLGGVTDLVRASFPRLFPDAPIAVPDAVATAVPSLAALGDAAIGAIMLPALAVVAIHAWTAAKSAAMRALLLVALLFALMSGGAGISASELATELVRAALALGVAFAVVRFLCGANPMAYLYGALVFATLGPVMALLAQPGAFYRMHGWLLAGIVALVAAAAIGRRSRPDGGVG